MIDLVLELNNKDKVIYKYVPVGFSEDDFGRVQLDKRNGEITILQEDKNKLQASLRHAVLAIHSFYEDGKYPEKKEIAWY